MALDFPAAPTVGATYASAGVVWVFDGVKWNAGPSAGGYLPLSGGTLTGNLSGTNAAFSGQVSGASGNISGALSVGGLATAQSPPAGDSSADLAPTSWVQGLLVGWQNRNRLINGSFLLDQYNNYVSVTPAATIAYICDRWQLYGSAASKFASRVFNASVGGIIPGAPGYLQVATAAAYTPLATDGFQLSQKLEFQNIADFGFGAAGALPVTLSFWALCSANAAGTWSGSFCNSDGSRTFAFTFSLPAGQTWYKIVIPIPGDTTGTWVYAANANAAWLRIDTGCGANNRAPVLAANQWTGTNFTGVAGTVQLVTIAGGAFCITNVQLELGPQATPFDFRSYGAELALAQRYYERDVFSSGLIVATAAGQYLTGSPSYRVTKRAVPTLSTQQQLALTNCAAPTLDSIQVSGFRSYSTATAAGGAAYQHLYAVNAEL